MAEAREPGQEQVSNIIDIVRLSIGENGSLAFELNWILVLMFGLIGLLLWAFNATRTGRFSPKDYEIDEKVFGIGKNKIKLRPNLGDRTVAYKIWVELSTRKIGLKIDPDHDIIYEIYDSWYSFFQVTRELIKDVPVAKARGDSTQKIINLSIDILNEGLRPHLTKWQARFRRWYEYRMDVEDFRDFHPQDVQKKYPDFEELLADMLDVNKRLQAYRAKLREVVFE